MSFVRWFLVGFISLICVSVGVTFYFFFKLSPLDINGKEILYRLRPGTSFSELAYELHQKRLIRDEYAFKLYARLRGWQNKVQTGYYRLSSDMSASYILKKLVLGHTEKIPYTIPEGYRASQASKGLSKYQLSPERYLQWVKNPDPKLSNTFPFLTPNILKKGLEGFLFPDTYYLSGSEKDLIYAQLKRFQEIVIPLWNKRPADHTLNLFETVTLASIVELEGLLDRELPIIAGIFLKRLSIGMKLESDPTTEFALGWHQGSKGLSLKDIQIDSPYNTYRYPGLPPGPIGNPGLAAIKAVIYPKKTPFLYFVARGDGSHAFSKTYEEHLSAIRRIYAGKS